MTSVVNKDVFRFEITVEVVSMRPGQSWRKFKHIPVYDVEAMEMFQGKE
jgi:hypothetical protein